MIHHEKGHGGSLNTEAISSKTGENIFFGYLILSRLTLLPLLHLAALRLTLYPFETLHLVSAFTSVISFLFKVKT